MWLQLVCFFLSQKTYFLFGWITSIIITLSFFNTNRKCIFWFHSSIYMPYWCITYYVYVYSLTNKIIFYLFWHYQYVCCLDSVGLRYWEKERERERDGERTDRFGMFARQSWCPSFLISVPHPLLIPFSIHHHNNFATTKLFLGIVYFWFVSFLKVSILFLFSFASRKKLQHWGIVKIGS